MADIGVERSTVDEGFSQDGQLQVLTKDVKSTKTTIPFFKDNEFDYAWFTSFAGKYADELGWLLFVLVTIFIITAVSNGANLTDGLDGHLLFDEINILLGCADRSHTGARKAYLGCGTEFEYHIRVSFLLAGHKDLDEVVLLICIEVMDTVSIIPVDTEIFCSRFQSCKAKHRLV